LPRYGDALVEPKTTDDLRRFAVARSLFPETTILGAIEQLGFLQADPIRSPARAQDLTLRQRVIDYRAGDLERAYDSLPIEEDYLLNYGFLPRAHVDLMHPRTPRRKWDKKSTARAEEILAFVKERGRVHPREVDAHFAHGRVKNYWGGSSSASTHLLEGMHYRGLLRVAKRDGGIRVYEPQTTRTAIALSLAERRTRATALLDLCVKKYAPLPLRTVTRLAYHLRYGAPQLLPDIKAAAARAKATYRSVTLDGVQWLWPEDVDTTRAFAQAPDTRVRILAPFDPIVWDRARFELLFGWEYRFEAYTPEKKRKLGYYAMPMLYRDNVIGWVNASAKEGDLDASFGYVKGKAPRETAFRRELDLEMDRLREFLAISDPDLPPKASEASARARPRSRRRG